MLRPLNCLPQEEHLIQQLGVKMAGNGLEIGQEINFDRKRK